MTTPEDKTPEETQTHPPAPPKVVSLRERAGSKMLCDKHREELRASGLGDETITAMAAYCEHDGKVIAEALNWKAWPKSMGHCLMFGYVPPGADTPSIFRAKPERPRERESKGKIKLTKYEGPKNLVGGTPPYFPKSVRTEEALRGDAPMVLTEGEKKTELLAQLGYPAVGFGGVYAFHDVAAKNDRGEWRMHSLFLEHVRVAGRSFVICYDSDSRTNEDVMRAAQQLAACLARAGAARVQFVCPPQPDDKKRGIDDYCLEHGPTATRNLISTAADIEPADISEPLQPLSSQKILRDAPVAKNLRMPEGYEFDNAGGLWKKAQDEKQSDKRVAAGPVLIVRYVDDYYSGQGRVEVCWRVDHVWKKYLVERRSIADRGHMLSELTPLSAPITSGSAPAVVDWLEAFEAANRGKMERAVGLARAGWHDIEGKRVFVLNEVVSNESATLPKLSIDDRGDRKRTFAALAPRGNEAAHVAALKTAWEASPIVAMLIAGAFAAPLLEIIDAPNFAIHLPGDSSKGKTSMLKCAASVFGDPSNEQWVASWNTTAVAAELRAASLSGLPLCFDEVGAADKTTIERMVYMLINGGGRSRGNKDLQLRETPSWRTILLSTGEHQLAEDDANTGAQVRVLQFSVQGFGELDAKGVDAVREACVANCGWAGRKWIEKLLDMTAEDVAALRAQYRVGAEKLRSKAGDGLQGRQALYFALLWIVETQISRLLGIGDPRGATVFEAFKLAIGGDAMVGEVRPLHERARDLVMDWFYSEPHAWPRLILTPGGAKDVVVDKGQKTVHGYVDGEELLVLPTALRDRLRDHGLSYKETLRGWKTNEFTRCNTGKTDLRVRIGDRNPHLVCLKLGAEEHMET